MISVQNHRPPLSGNKWLPFFCIALLLAACSPKTRPVATTVKKPTDNTEKKPGNTTEKPAEKASEQKVANIAMLLPLNLEHLNPAQKYSPLQISQANIAVEYYQGFKLALDSLTAYGNNYKLQIFDSRDEAMQAHDLALNAFVRSSDLIVGPVFPDGVKAFSGALSYSKGPILSPLSPANPATINSKNLITAIPPLEYHAWGAAEYLNRTVKPKKIFILRSGFNQENDYAVNFKKAIDSLSKKKIKVTNVYVVRGKLSSLLPQLSKTEKNVFVIPATDQAFLGVTLRSLDTLNKHYPVMVFGHPSWEKFSFLKPQLLQRLNTHITSTEKINYKAGATTTFLRNYRRAYHVEPTEYAIKGFDEGLYFGRQLFADKGLSSIEGTDFTGLHNSFHFIKKPGQGWINTHVNILMYTNFELKQVE
ncbi:ABC transporter substrate-binding protein [Mucilaginibacter rubeus]|uniref:Amino acid ABC transporter substrate-binding protein n=1 Tax=Mucilaginibacter rubeus TaxID=2027860 RepID=A0A5C1HVQ5_9SPHI|nr:amino acid ABC transporter substrate-binding protein [Mucilaginibacter rubeus]QEM08838.1 amino acid ABC transporter substrate-binding protein [Mucilaginibacter rubeus]